MKERLIAVDDNDQPIAIVSREEAWERGLTLRHSYIILRDHEGNFLLQKRSQSKKKFPGRLTWAATGHVDEGESYETAAYREMAEEIGVKTELRLIDKVRGATLNKLGQPDTFISLFEGIIDHNTVLSLDASEVESTEWLSLEEIKQISSTDPERLTPNMCHTFNLIYGG